MDFGTNGNKSMEKSYSPSLENAETIQENQNDSSIAVNGNNSQIIMFIIITMIFLYTRSTNYN